MILISTNIRYVDIRGGFSGRVRQMTVELSTTAIFSVFGGYLIENVREIDVYAGYTARRLFSDP